MTNKSIHEGIEIELANFDNSLNKQDSSVARNWYFIAPVLTYEIPTSFFSCAKVFLKTSLRTGECNMCVDECNIVSTMTIPRKGP